MSDPSPHAGHESRRSLPFSATWLAAAFILFLALAAILMPESSPRLSNGIFLVVDPLGAARGAAVFSPLSEWLGSESGRPLHLHVVTRLGELGGLEFEEIDLVLCPDGVALGLPPERYVTLAAGRRPTPYNLRPRSVLVYRQALGAAAMPWLRNPERVIFGDSLSLAGCGPILRRTREVAESGSPWPAGGGWTFGPDPYDHAPALHALRLGCFDYAVVREWAADRFLTDRLLDPRIWGVENLTAPLPDVVLMVSRRVPAAEQVRLGEIVVKLGRFEGRDRPEERRVLDALNGVDLAGFNLLLEPDFEPLRRRFAARWPRPGS